MATVARFNVTPVKSTRLHHPEEVRIERYGVAGNRELFLVDRDGRLFGGTKLGELVRIVAELDPPGDVLRLRFPDGTVVEGSAQARGERIQTSFYGRQVVARVVDGPWAAHLTRFAGRELRLARVARAGDGNDVRPVTLVSLASVRELSRQGGREEPVDARRFRMTIELEALEAHEEDSWTARRVRIGGALLLVGEPVPRCVVTTQDPDTGVRDFPTLSVIKRYRDVSEDGDLPFGVYASVVEPGTARVGDLVTPL
jgi:uncharacterized protein YcbX